MRCKNLCKYNPESGVLYTACDDCKEEIGCKNYCHYNPRSTCFYMVCDDCAEEIENYHETYNECKNLCKYNPNISASFYTVCDDCREQQGVVILIMIVIFCALCLAMAIFA